MEEAAQSQQMPFSDDQKLQRIVQTIAKAVAPKRIYLFGSQAKQTARPESDFDLLIVADMNMSHRERRIAIRRLFPQPDFSLDLFVLTKDEFERQRNIPNTIARTVDRDGIFLFG